MLRLSEIYVAKIILEKKYASPPQMKEAFHLVEKEQIRLREALIHLDILQENHWEECYRNARQMPQWPNSPANVALDNRIISQKLQKKPIVNMGRFREAWQTCDSLQYGGPALRLHEILLHAQMIDEETIQKELDIQSECTLICNQCQNILVIEAHFPWHLHPCPFCEGHLFRESSQNFLSSGEGNIVL